MWEFPLGDRAMNLEIAIASYEICLTVFPPEEFPQEWAITQNNLGTAYLYRIAGVRSENLERVVAGYNDALKVLTHQPGQLIGPRLRIIWVLLTYTG
ncbi:MAG: hypothetical protein GDA43_13300 [Hormoscilla sp. SP5CHS1]|nr:hypothetical protein [Hormoscilla sp. SP12CHS1]MBC6454047.1 hypothetical protein [Hormoscilla sp. SP5CHS1]